MLYSLFSLYVPKFLERLDQLTSTQNTCRSAHSLTKFFIHTDAIHHQEMGVGTAETKKGIAEECFMDAPFPNDIQAANSLSEGTLGPSAAIPVIVSSLLL